MLGPSPRKKPECNHWRAIPPAKTKEKAQKRFREFFFWTSAGGREVVRSTGRTARWELFISMHWFAELSRFTKSLMATV
jgi:hypothetical protein